jgi:hypothetical protein
MNIVEVVFLEGKDGVGKDSYVEHVNDTAALSVLIRTMWRGGRHKSRLVREGYVC